jgi:hypothetical protein
MGREEIDIYKQFFDDLSDEELYKLMEAARRELYLRAHLRSHEEGEAA